MLVKKMAAIFEYHKFGIRVLTRDDLTTMLERTLFLPNPDFIFEEQLQALKAMQVAESERMRG